MPNNIQSQEILDRKKFLETKIAELSDRIKYIQMNKHEFEECIDERKEYLKEYRDLEDPLKKPESKESL